MAKKRLIWADSLKGWLIMLVVLGHAIQNVLGAECGLNHIWNIIYSFHMSAFMAVSGYLAYRPNASYCFKEDCIPIIYRRVKQLLVPFALWTIILLVVGNKLSLQTIGEYLLFPDKGLWFLWALFFINVLFLFGGWLAKIMNLKQEIIEVVLCLTLSVVMILFELRILGFQFIAFYFIFYTIGYYFNKYYNNVVSTKLNIILPFILCWIVMAWFWQMHTLPVFLQRCPVPSTIMQYGYRFVTALFAIYILLALSPKLLDTTSLWNRGMIYMGNVSLGIYAVHYIILSRIVVLLKSTYCFDNSMLIICSFTIGLLVSLIIVWLLARWRITSIWLMGKI